MIYWDVILKFIYQSFSRISLMLAGLKDSYDILGQCVPQSNFGIIGTIRLFTNPILDLLPCESNICRNNFEHYIERIKRPSHFREDILSSATQLFFLDFFEFHYRIYGDSTLPESTALIMRRFLGLLERGDYLKEREVAYLNYA